MPTTTKKTLETIKQKWKLSKQKPFFTTNDLSIHLTIMKKRYAIPLCFDENYVLKNAFPDGKVVETRSCRLLITALRRKPLPCRLMHTPPLFHSSSTIFNCQKLKVTMRSLSTDKN